MAMLHKVTCCYTTWGVEIDNSPGYQDEGESSKVENGGAFLGPRGPLGAQFDDHEMTGIVTPWRHPVGILSGICFGTNHGF